LQKRFYMKVSELGEDSPGEKDASDGPLCGAVGSVRWLS
jgi:hypothetical protein